MNKNPYYRHLSQRWSEKNQKLHKTLVTKHNDIYTSHRLASRVIGGLMLAGAPFLSAGSVGAQEQLIQPVPVPTPSPSPFVSSSELAKLLKSKLPNEVRPLSVSEEEDIGILLSSSLGIHVSAELSGIRLNRSFGLIGQEQHLPRFPGDSMAEHFDSSDEADIYSKYGMTPGRGAWGYFANTRYSMTEQDKSREKYYIAVQTFLAPGWNENVSRYKDFFKYRKMLLVNPDNGHAIVADIADAGPAASTGKHLGGSPEVMKYLERVDGAQKGPVLYFFIEDSDATIPLGPVAI